MLIISETSSQIDRLLGFYAATIWSSGLTLTL